MEPILELYGTCKTVGEDSQSDDVLMFICSAPQANSPENKNLNTMYKVMKSLSPKLQKPKIGKVRVNQLDVLRRQKQQPAFFGSNINEFDMLFSMQRKGPMCRNDKMIHLKDGHLYFNTWPINAIPFAQMMKVSKATHEKMFLPTTGGQATLAADSDDEAQPPTTDELTLENDMLVPFPHELSKELGLEIINVFAADVIITTTVGSGAIFEATLQKHKFGVGICQTATHKKQVIQKLKEYVKTMNLVSLNDAPAKPADLLKYEADLQRQATGVPKADSVLGVPKAAVPKAAVPKETVPTPAVPNAVPTAVPKAVPKAADAAVAATITTAPPQTLSMSVAVPKLAGFGGSLL